MYLETMPTVHFVGGPKHGETMAVPRVEHEIRVVIPERLTYEDFHEPVSPIGPAFRTGRYRLHPQARQMYVPVYLYDGEEGEPRRRTPEWSPEYLSPDAHSMSFANMTAEAEAELAAWRGILHPAE